MLPRILGEAGIPFDLHLTERRGHAVDLAREAIEGGSRYLVAVGGDGTIHEVVNGMMGESGPRNPEAVLGVLSAGSGSDYIRTFGLPAKPVDAVEHLKGDTTLTVDVGRITYRQDGGEAVRYFPNIGEAGFGGEVVRRAERLPRRLGRVRYLLGFWMVLGTCKATEGTVAMDAHSYEGRITNLVVANAQFYGGGMHVAPKAHPGDGAFDVLIQVGTKGDYVAAITKVYKGEHIPSPAIKTFLSKRVEITTREPLQIEADGEILGRTPAVFEICPGTLRLKI